MLATAVGMRNGPSQVVPATQNRVESEMRTFE
ncbi:hypothetical protein ThimaDRAFT_3052 [Thiocapsa marina 5811]|uniref:Uncharacterized protein n=1 Tax=Thiocapsa marina 5811 TaxID=768671 RepID=F9UDV0_9GAMM|nr:hypothetical protein ThimaDRAFT_3052 [Thiocapsa marina 5811]